MSSNFIKAALQKYPLNSAVGAKSGQRNLMELVSRFPKQGAGMRVFKKSWPDNCYWEINYAHMRSVKTGRLYGIQYWNGERKSNKIDKIPGVLKRGVWQFDINGAFELTEDEIQRLLKEREPKEEEPAEETAEEGEKMEA